MIDSRRARTRTLSEEVFQLPDQLRASREPTADVLCTFRGMSRTYLSVLCATVFFGGPENVASLRRSRSTRRSQCSVREAIGCPADGSSEEQLLSRLPAWRPKRPWLECFR
jgi:hypothetical protein